jgi:hypothetical protein
MRRILLAGLALGAMSLVMPGLASAAQGGGNTAAADTFVGSATTSSGDRLAVAVTVKRFVATAAGTQAQGVANATLTGLGRLPTTVTKNVTLAAARGGTCTILTLTLNTLDLKLLGLDVHLDKVVLTLTGQRHGGILGSLFCSLAGAKAKLARTSAVSRLNSAIRKTGTVHPLRFSVAVRAQTAQAPAAVCSVLDLVLGPLHLDLLGLVVDLNQVHLTITADPNGGVLGSLFCGLANTKV